MLKRVLRRAETSGRVDDNVDTFEKRYQGFLDDSMPVLGFFQSRDKLIKVSSSTKFLGYTNIGRLTANARWRRYMMTSRKSSM